MNADHFFQNVTEFPDASARRQFDALVGLDEVKIKLLKEARLMLIPELLDQWSKKHYGQVIPLTRQFKNRLPLFVFSGDVGTGKTALAESFGDAISREQNIPITLYELSLSTRGSGAVGEMTRLLSTAFEAFIAAAEKGTSQKGGARSAAILMIDEADALAQSRELSQMHHEDRAGVNALIRGINQLAKSGHPAIVVMCTNRLDSLDPAVKRRAAAIFEFERPNLEQRTAIIRRELEGVNLTQENLVTLGQLTGDNDSRDYGYTYSDLTQRFLPTILLDAFPDNHITFERAVQILNEVHPTPPFKGGI